MTTPVMMPSPGAAKAEVPKNGIGMAFWIAGVPGKALIVKVKAPSAIVAGISRFARSALAKSAAAIGKDGERHDEERDAAIGHHRAGEHDREDRLVVAQQPDDGVGQDLGTAGILDQLAEDGAQEKEREEARDEAPRRPHENLRVAGDAPAARWSRPRRRWRAPVPG